MKPFLCLAFLALIPLAQAAEPTTPVTLPPVSAPLSPRVTLRAPDAADGARLDAAQALKPRRPLTRTEIDQPSRRHLVITMKIRDAHLARPEGGDGVSLLDGEAGREFSRFAEAQGLRFAPEIDLDAAVLEAVEAKAAANSGTAQPVLSSLFFVQAPHAGTIAEAHAVTVALNGLAAVEYANVRSLHNTPPPPGDIAPPTPDFRPSQTWRGLGHETGGASIDYAWSYLGRGAGVRVIDIEQAYNPNHEDLVDLGIQDFSVGNPTGPTQDLLNSYIDHGTKTFGVLAAPDNGYGVVGAAPLATLIGFASNFTDNDTGILITCPDPDAPQLQIQANSRTGRALVIATNELAITPGNVILLEVQAFVENATGFTPAETEEVVFCTTKLATDAGLIVVGAAGNIPANGGPAQNLDANVAGLNAWRNWGDSGAIIVGAGEANTAHAKLSFSAFGSRVNVQAWGEGVETTGTGYPPIGADPNQSYGPFSGTSSASAVVAATCMAVQSARLARFPGTRLTSTQMRTLLRNTGNAQTTSPSNPGLIGPAVDARRAIDSFLPSITEEKVNTDSVPILYNFTGQTMASLVSWDPVEDANGGDAEVISGAIRLSNGQPGFLNTPVHAIADWHLGIEEPVPSLILEFDSTVIADTFDGAALDSYLGMANADGVFLSNDGEHWTRIPFPEMETQTASNGSVHYVASLDAAAMEGGFPLLGHIRVRFQHYGPNMPTTDGRIYDNVRLSQQDLGFYEVSHAERNIVEGGSTSISVNRIGDTDFISTVDFEVRAITATVGTEITTSEGVSGTLLFKEGVDEMPLNLQTLQDSLPENTETALFILRNPSGGVSLGANFQITIRIIDNDQAGPERQHFFRAGNFAIPGVAAVPGFQSGPAPITLAVSGVTAPVTGIEVKISDLTHAAPALLDLILESPSGGFCKLMSDVGEGVNPNRLTNIQFCFETGAPLLPTNVLLSSGTYAPTDGQPGNDALLSGTNVSASNTGSLTLFNGQDPNGTWKLHIVESGVGDVSVSNFAGGGLLQGGYELVFITSLPPLPVWTETETLPSGASRFRWIGEAGSVFTLQFSLNLSTWTDEPGFTNVTMTGSMQQFTAQGGTRFFRWRRP